MVDHKKSGMINFSLILHKFDKSQIFALSSSCGNLISKENIDFSCSEKNVLDCL